MRKVLQHGLSLVSMSQDEIQAISRLISYVCNSKEHSDTDFLRLFGKSRADLGLISEALNEKLHPSRQAGELVDVWPDQSTVMVRVITTSGDPVEMGENEYSEFLDQLQRAIVEAS